MGRALITVFILYLTQFFAVGFLCHEDFKKIDYRSFYRFKYLKNECDVKIRNKYRKILVKKDNDGYCTIYILRR